jgi:hypothetical protein
MPLTTAQRRAFIASQRAQRPFGQDEPQPSFWSQYGGEIMVGVITAVVSAVATYFAMRAVAKDE